MSNEYKIEAIEDIITKIPEDRFETFLAELVAGLRQTKATYEVIRLLGDVVGEAEPVTGAGFTWVDDGEATLTTRLIDDNDVEHLKIVQNL